MKFTDILKTAGVNLRRSKSRTILTILAIFIGSFTITLTSGINTGVNAYLDKQVQNVGAENYMDVLPGDISESAGGILESSEPQEYDPELDGASMETISTDDVAKMEKIDGIESVTVYQSVTPEYIQSEENTKKYVLSPQNMAAENMKIDMKAGRLPKLDSSTPEIALAPGYAKLMGYRSESEIVGKTMVVAVKNLVTGEITEVDAKVSGVQDVSLISRGRSWINASLQERLYDTATEGLPQEIKDRAFAAGVTFTKGLDADGVQEIKDNLLKMGLTGMTIEDEIGMMKTVMTAISAVLIIFGVIALLAASIGIVNTLFMSVQERTREIGLMKAMGLSRGKIFAQFTFEAIMLGFWGSVIGIGVAYLAKLFVNSVVVKAFFDELPSFTLINYDILTLIVIIAVVVLIAFLAGTLPARSASRLDPIDALKYE
ncbi:MAG: ABC transporter permease [Clostridiales Family XIII bacterium]|jgi:putative ABC transport system permease protein|nr:ABC transporter permease [Clostridiales Family XIII bacterium]